MTRIAFAWPGLPDYAARCIRAVIDRKFGPVQVVATRPSVPIEGMERSLGQPIQWIEANAANVSWERIGHPVPEVLFVGGYAAPAFNALTDQCRDSGGRTILMSDINWQATLRQRFFDPLRHKICLHSRFDGVFVPGASGQRFARRMGYPAQRIFQGLYGADPAIFHGRTALVDRPRALLFVGQFVARKNVLNLTEAFLRFLMGNPNWSLGLCGSGPLCDQLPKHPRIRVHDFVQPPQLAELMGSARCLVLPSSEEHWGLVVHEATLSGCALVLTSAVGSAEDLACEQNAILLQTARTTAIESGLREIASWSDRDWFLAEHISRELAGAFGPEHFALAVTRVLKTFDYNVEA